MDAVLGALRGGRALVGAYEGIWMQKKVAEHPSKEHKMPAFSQLVFSNEHLRSQEAACF